MEGLQASLILLTLMSVPLSAVVGYFYVKAKKIGRAVDLKEVQDKLEIVLAEQAVQKHRIETLEAIVVDDPDIDTRRRFRKEGITLPPAIEEGVTGVEAEVLQASAKALE